MKIGLRQMQLKSANSGNVSMLIWLGKQYLGQRSEGAPESRPVIDIQARLAELEQEIALNE
jgi:hypothetical protein